MSIAPTEEATRILKEWNHGDTNAAARQENCCELIVHGFVSGRNVERQGSQAIRLAKTVELYQVERIIPSVRHHPSSNQLAQILTNDLPVPSFFGNVAKTPPSGWLRRLG